MQDIQLIEDNFKLRDIKDGDWYWVNKSIIFDYAKKINATGIMVYSLLACFANKNQSCFPSQKYISEKLGCSRATVNRTLKELEDKGLIRIEKIDKYRCAYHLLKVGCQALEKLEQKGESGETDMARDETSEFHRKDTNDKYLSRNNNNNIDIDNINNIDSVTNSDMGINPLTREEFIAYDLAEALNDPEGIALYISYAKRFPESLLRGTLGDVLEIPDEKIRKSRAALFNHIISKHINKHDKEDNRD